METILSIPVSNTRQDDRLIWRCTGSGVFSVKSAYHLQKDLDTRQVAEGSSHMEDTGCWRFIWNQQISNAEKSLFWRACHESLPTCDNLCRRKVINDPRCLICETEVETTFQVLW